MTVIEASRSVELRIAFAALAPLFRYPDHAGTDEFRAAESALTAIDAAAAGAIRAFRETMSAIDFTARQMAFTATFDLAPSCSPYLGVHLFGDDSPHRAQLMVGLRAAYRRHQADSPSRELPDHLAEVLAFAPYFTEDEWSDLARLVLAPALAKMDELLRPTVNPYRHLVAIVRHLAESAASEGARA